jgi:RNA polymerase sigma-70 factor, ECF subfamily
VTAPFVARRKTRAFLGNSYDFAAPLRRGTAIAMGAFNMNTTVNAAEKMQPTATTPDQWVEAHGDYLFNFAIGQLRDAGVAEDLVQDTFLAAFKARERFAGQSSERTWLVGILRHKISEHLRHTCRERAVRADVPASHGDGEAWEDAVMWLHDVAAESQSPSRRLELAEFRSNLELALGKLPPRVAQVFQLYEVEECPNSEVCRRINISESNLWVMLHRARKQLRGHLTDWWNAGSQQNQHSNTFSL